MAKKTKKQKKPKNQFGGSVRMGRLGSEGKMNTRSTTQGGFVIVVEK